MSSIRPNKEIRAVYTDETIRVYQAYNRNIAEEAVKNDAPAAPVTPVATGRPGSTTPARPAAKIAE